MLAPRRTYGDSVSEAGTWSMTLEDSLGGMPEDLSEKLEKLSHLNK